MKHPLPLRYSLPIALGLLAGLLAGINFGLDWAHTTHAVEALTVRRAAALGNLLTRNLERHFSRNDPVAVTEEIAALNGVPSLTVGLVCDETDRILFATGLNLRQVPFAETEFGGGAPLLARARASLTAQFEITPDRAAVRAAFPFTLGLQPGELRSSRVAVFYTQTDLAGLMRTERLGMGKQSLAMAGVAGLGAWGIWFYLRSTLTRRVESLVAATQEVAAGNLGVETRLQGSDELAALGASFNRMAAELRDRAAALRASEERFHAFLRQSPMVAWVKDDTFRFRYANPAFERLFARSAAEIVGQTDFDLLPADARETRAHDQRVADTGESLEKVEVVAGADGRPRHWLVQRFPLPQPGRAPWVGGTAMDITARVEAEQVLRQVLAGTGPELGRDFFRALVEHLAGALQVKYAFVGELTGPDRDRVRILSLWADGQPAEPVEYPLKGTPCEQVLDRRQCLFSQAAQQQFPDDALLREMGVESYLGVPLHDRAGTPMGLLAVLHDRPLPDLEINRLLLSIFGGRAGAELERLRAEETLRVSEARLRSIVHLTPHVAIQGYDSGGRVELWNEASARMFGWSSEEATGRTLDDLIFTPTQAANFAKSIRDLAGTGRSLGPVEYLFRRRNGEAGQCLSTLFEVAGAAGEPLFVCMDVDITERKQAEVRLRQSQEQFQTLFRSSPLAGVLFSPETAVFVDANDRFSELSGYSREEAVGRSGEALGLWCDLADRDRLLAALKQQEELHGFEVRLKTKDGRTLDTLLSAQRLDLPVGPVVMVQAVDLTERKRAEQALREKDELLRRVIDLVPHFIFAKDRHGRFLFANRAAAEAAGLPPDDLVGRSDLDLQRDPAEAAAFVQDDQEVIRSGAAKFIPEERLTDAAGRVRIHQTVKVPFQVPGTGEPALLGVAVDITERQRAEEALRGSQAMITAIINAIPVRVFWKDREFRYLGCNEAFAHDAGFAAPADLIGKDDYQMGWHAQADLYRADDRRIIEEGATRLHIEEPMTLPNGTTITLLTSKTPLRNSAGEITGVLGTYLDITARKEAEAARTRLETQLRQAQKMEAIGTLAGGIAHDFNNILGVILSNAQLAAMDTAPGHPAAESLAEIALAGQRAKGLVEQILAFSRQQPTHQRLVEAAAIVTEVTRFLKATLPAGVELVATVEPGCPPILADATQVHQILVNLATNAWHALGDLPGRISLGLCPVQLPDGRLAPAPELPAGTYVRFTVTDTGSGMAAATLKRIFDPFFTTKPPGQGTGLGLSVVHGIVQQHRGTIQVESQPGAGSTFTVYLPAAAPVAEPAPGPANPPAGRTAPGLRVLVLDDEEALLLVTRRLLTRLGHRVEGFGQPAAALARFHEDPGAFDLVITDFNMPGQSGLAIAAEIFRLRPGLPVLLVSGKVTDDLRRRARELGIREVLTKPVAFDELTAAVQREVALRAN